MKRLTALLLAALLLCLTACQADTPTPPADEDNTPGTVVTPPAGTETGDGEETAPSQGGQEEAPDTSDEPEVPDTPKQPDTPKEPEPPKQPQAPAVDNTAGPKLVALTFDDGPGPYTEKLLDTLKSRGVPATFFCLGSRAVQYPKVVRRAYDEGHQIASHTYSHYELIKLDTAQIQSEISSTAAALNKAIGCENSYLLRLPYGSFNDAVRQAMGGPGLNWSVDPRDWATTEASVVVDNVMNAVFDGAVVLLHDIQPHTVQAVGEIVDRLQSQGYELVTVNELFRRRGVTMQNGEIYYSAKYKGTQLPAFAAPEVSFTLTEQGLLATLTAEEGANIYYTADGSAPSGNARLYTEPFLVEEGAQIRAFAAVDKNGGRSGEAAATAVAPALPEEPVTPEDPAIPEDPAPEEPVPEDPVIPEAPVLPEDPVLPPEEESAGDEQL